jgi:hypothetical protein
MPLEWRTDRNKLADQQARAATRSQHNEYLKDIRLAA